MALSWKARRRLSILVLAVWLPVYVILAVNVVAWLGRPPVWLELLVYVGLGVVWVLPFRRLFLGVGRPDPEADDGDA